MERVEQLFCRPPQQPAGNNAAKTLLKPSQPAGRADALPYGHTLEAELRTFVFSSPESRATFLFPTHEKVHMGKGKTSRGASPQRSPRLCIKLAAAIWEGKEQSILAVSGDRQPDCSGRGEGIAAPAPLPPHTVSFPRRRARLRYSPTEPKGLGLGMGFF